MENFFDWKRQLQRRDGFDPLTIDQLPYYEYLHYQKGLAKDLEEEAKRQKAEQKQHSQMNMKSKMPSMPKMNLGKFFKK
jgi:hypothetical protein